jgi:putative sporulation protein YtaF
MIEYHLSIILLMAISCNLDNIGIGIAYGARGVSIPFESNLLIAAITTCGTCIALVFGQSVHIILKPDIAKYTGSLIIICAGIWIIGREIISDHEKSFNAERDASAAPSIGKRPFAKIMMILNNPFIADADLSNHIDLREGATLGLALTLNNIANGVGAGMIGLNIMLLTLLVFIVSIVTIWVGIKIGAYYGHRIFGRLTGFAAGILLVVIGVYEIIF